MTTLIGVDVKKSFTGPRIPYNKKVSVWDGNFYCHRRELTSLEGSPTTVKGDFNCDYNYLTDLRGSPDKVLGSFVCGYNTLKTLEGAPKLVLGNFGCSHNPSLTTLHDVHKQIKQMDGQFRIRHLITSHVLGLLYIEGCTSVSFTKGESYPSENLRVVEKILNDYLAKPRTHREVIACQSELLDAGLDEFAQL